MNTLIYSTTPPANHLHKFPNVRRALYSPPLSSYTNDNTGVLLKRMHEGRVVSVLSIGAPFIPFAPAPLVAPFLKTHHDHRSTPKTRLNIETFLIDPCPFHGAQLFAGLNIMRIIGHAGGYSFVDAVLIFLAGLCHQTSTVSHLVASIFPNGEIAPYFRPVVSFVTLIQFREQAVKLVKIAIALSIGKLEGHVPKPILFIHDGPIYIRVDSAIPPFECTHNKLRSELLAVVRVVGLDYFTKKSDKTKLLVIDLADHVMSLLPRGRESFSTRIRAILQLGLASEELRAIVKKTEISTSYCEPRQDPMLDIIMDILYRRSDNLTAVEREILFTPDQTVCDLDFLE